MGVDVTRAPPTIPSCLVLLLLLLGAALARGRRVGHQHYSEHMPPLEPGPQIHHQHGKIRAPFECPWFTNALRHCARTRLSTRRFEHILAEIDNETYTKGLLLCLTRRAVEAPDGIYCTDRESVHILKSCVEDNLAEHSRTRREEAKELTNEMEKCLQKIHHEKITRRRHRIMKHHHYHS